MFLKNLKNRNVSGLFSNFLDGVINYDYKPTNLIGNTTNESGVDKDGYTWHTTKFTSHDGSYISTSTVKTKVNNSFPNENTWFSQAVEKYNTMNKFNEQRKDVKSTQAGKSATNRIDVLKDELEVAIKSQKFEEAIRLRNEIEIAKTNQSDLTALKVELELLVKDYNFEKAIEVRDKIKKMEKK